MSDKPKLKIECPNGRVVEVEPCKMWSPNPRNCDGSVENYRELLNYHNELFSKNAKGWAIAIEGTKRISYLAKDASITYNEKEVYVYADKNQAAKLMWELPQLKPFTKFTRLVAFANSEETTMQLPTVNGY